MVVQSYGTTLTVNAKILCFTSLPIASTCPCEPGPVVGGALSHASRQGSSRPVVKSCMGLILKTTSLNLLSRSLFTHQLQYSLCQSSQVHLSAHPSFRVPYASTPLSSSLTQQYGMAFRDENGRKPLPPTPWEPGYRTHRRFHDAVEYLPAQEWPAAPNNSPASTSSRKHKRTGAADWTRIPRK